MQKYCPMTELPPKSGYGAGDFLVLVGELFGRGYANGLVEEAKHLGMKVIGTTVGRRDSDGTLRQLTQEELTTAEELLGSRIINIPLEAGFDMEPVDGTPSISEQLKKAKPDDWEKTYFEPGFPEKARAAGTARFRRNLSLVMQELEGIIPASANIVFAHTMAGGIPRARVFMPLLNRVFKGTGDKYLASEPFWNSGLGRLCDTSFNEVTADTFSYLIEESAAIRERNSAAGGRTAYTAYGYHGTGILLEGEYRWQSYTPYLQGFAKMRLEDHAADARQKGINATVFNCPEIQTNSSALFLGVELSLFPLVTSLGQKAANEAAPLFEKCSAMLKDGVTLNSLVIEAEAALKSPVISGCLDFATWPQHSTKGQMEAMLAASASLMEKHTDQKQLVCAELSRLVFLATGHLMLQASWSCAAPALWLNHDIISLLVASGSLNKLVEA